MDSLPGVASGDVRSTPQRRPFLGQALRSANDPKRTLEVYGKLVSTSLQPVAGRSFR